MLNLKFILEKINKNDDKTMLNAISKFKPITASEKSTDGQINKLVKKEALNFDLTSENVDSFNENSQDDNVSHEIGFFNMDSNPSQIQQNSNAGFAAAGFKKFVKKSISIRLKTTEPTGIYMKPHENAFNIENDTKKITNPSEIELTTPIRDFDNNYNDLGSDEYDEFQNELSTLLNFKSKSTKNIEYTKGQQYTSQIESVDIKKSFDLDKTDSSKSLSILRNSKNTFIDGKSSDNLEYDLDVEAMQSCDYNYELDEDLSNFDSEIENTSRKDDFYDTDTSYCSTCFSGNFQAHKNSLNFSNDDSYCSSCSSRDSDECQIKKIRLKSEKAILSNSSKEELLKETRHKKKKDSRFNKHANEKTKTKKTSIKKQTTSNEKNKSTKDLRKLDKAGNSENLAKTLFNTKNILKKLIETQINKISEEDDIEMREILENLQNEIVNNELITLEECKYIFEKLKNLFSDANMDLFKQDQLAIPIKLVFKKDSFDESKVKSKKRKLKSNNINNNLEKKNRRQSRKTPKDKKSKYLKRPKLTQKETEKTMKKDNLDRSHPHLDDKFFNGKGEMMEAGEIDDMYDDEFLIEKELESLLGCDKNNRLIWMINEDNCNDFNINAF